MMPGLIPFNRNSLTRRAPNNDIFNMIDDFFNDSRFFGRSLMSDTFKMDIKEEEGAYSIEAELPGIQRDEISLSMDDGRLTLLVNRQQQTADEQANYIHRERRSESMQRSVYLANADDAGVSAKLSDGVLRITVAKKPASDVSKRIEIE